MVNSISIFKSLVNSISIFKSPVVMSETSIVQRTDSLVQSIWPETDSDLGHEISMEGYAVRWSVFALPKLLLSQKNYSPMITFP